MKKAKTPEHAEKLEQIPNIGPAIAEDLKLIGIHLPLDLKNKDPFELYLKLCHKTQKYHDPCVLDTMMSAVYFMNGKGSKTWWHFTKERKKKFHEIFEKVKRYK